MNKYEELRIRHSKEFNALPMKAAFGEEQFKNMMAEWGLTTSEEDIRKIRSLAPGAYCLATDVEKFIDLTIKHNKETEDFLKTDDGLKDAFMSEFDNQECGYTWEPKDALEALGFTQKDLKTERIKRIYEESWKEYTEHLED